MRTIPAPDPLPEHLDRHGPAQAQVESRVDAALPPPPQKLADLVSRENGASFEIHAGMLPRRGRRTRPRRPGQESRLAPVVRRLPKADPRPSAEVTAEEPRRRG